MIIYNVTINVDESIHDQWHAWMTEVHIPQMLETKKFIKALMTKVLVQEEMGGVTYSVQYTCASREILEDYYKNEANELRNEAYKLFGNKFGAFRTELEVVKEFNPE